MRRKIALIKTKVVLHRQYELNMNTWNTFKNKKISVRVNNKDNFMVSMPKHNS